MSFYEWLDNFCIFLKGYYAGMPIEKRCRPATEIAADAVRAYKVACNETDWIEDKEES